MNNQMNTCQNNGIITDLCMGRIWLLLSLMLLLSGSLVALIFGHGPEISDFVYWRTVIGFIVVSLVLVFSGIWLYLDALMIMIKLMEK